MPHTKDKWVIVFLIYADFRNNVDEFKGDAFAMTEQMKATLNSMFKDILTVPLDSNRARMFVIMNSIDYKEPQSSNTESKTLFYKIENPGSLKYNQITDCRVLSNRTGTIDRPAPGNPVQNPNILKNILAKNILVRKDEEVLFITWDHGSAFGIFREVDPGVAQIRKPIQYDLDRYPYLAEFWNKALEEDFALKELVDRINLKNRPSIIQIGHILFRLEVPSTEHNFLKNSFLMTQTRLSVRRKETASDDSKLYLVYDKEMDEFEVSNGSPVEGLIGSKKVMGKLDVENVREILSNDELAITFQNWLGLDRKVGVLLMMNCWMMNLHTMYSLVETVQCLVAPQSDIGTPGYNYKAILNYLMKDKYALSNLPQQLAIKCVKTIEKKRLRKLSKKLRNDQSDIIDTWKVFAFDLQTKDIDGNRLLLNQIEALNSLIDMMNRIACQANASQEARWMYKYVRSVCFDFSKRVVMMVDIVNWCLSLLYADGDFMVERKRKLDQEVSEELLNFRRQVLRKRPLPSLELYSTRGQLVYLLNDDVFQPRAVINVDPKGYSFFFPLFDIRPNVLHKGLLDNVKKDKLLAYLTNWKQFLKGQIDTTIDY